MDLIKGLMKKARHPGNWLVLTVILGSFGLPPAVVQALGAVLDVAPQVIDAAAVLIAGGAAVALPDPVLQEG